MNTDNETPSSEALASSSNPPLKRWFQVFCVWFIAIAVGGWTGKFLLESLNDPDPSVTADAAVATVNPSPIESRKRLVVVLLDGVGAEAWDRATMGEERPFPIAWSGLFDTGTPSLSRPGYHVILTGVDQALSAVRTNAYLRRARQDTVVDRLRAAGGQVAWALDSVQWFYELAGREGDARLNGANADDVSKVIRLYDNGANLLIVHWTRTDAVGHDHGSASDAYRLEVQTSVNRVARLYSALMQRVDATTDLQMYVGSDHGHLPRGGHGGPETTVRRVRWARLATHGDEMESSSYVRGVHSSGAMAATFADALGVQWPLQTVHPSVSDLPGASHEIQSLDATRRSAQWWQRWEQARSHAERSRERRAIALGLLWVGLGIYAAKRQLGKQWLGAWLVPFGAMLGYAAMGPGWSLSAIRTHVSFLLHSVGVMTCGAIVAIPLARRSGVRVTYVALASMMTALSAVWIAGASVGRSYLGDVGMVLAPAMGLVPSACALATMLLWGRGTRSTQRT